MTALRPPTHEMSPDANRDLRTVLREVEVHLRDRARLRLERAPCDPEVAGEDRGPRLRRALEAAAAEDPAAAARHARRLREALAGLALHAREIPPGALEGLYDDVRSATGQDMAWARARMSDAFLDAPLQLKRWRGAALAACAVLALGAGLFAGGRLGFDDGAGLRPLERQDPRNDLLPRLDADAAGVVRAGPRPSAGTLVSDPARPSVQERPSSYFVFYGDPRRASEAQRRLDAVLRLAPAGTRDDGVERN